MTPDQYCQQRAAASGSSFYYSFRFLPAEERGAIIALYAFCREVDDTVDDCREPSVARRKLDWWREEIGRVFDGSPQHPIGRALQQRLERFNLPREYFEEIIDGMQMDLERHRYASFKELALYCYRSAGVVGLLSAEIFGYSQRDTLRYATELGTALQLTNIIRDVREDAARGRIYLPQDELERFGVDPRSLLAFQTTPAFIELMQHQYQRAEDYYRRALALLPEADRYRHRSGLIMAAIYRATLEEIARDGFRVLEQRIALTPLRKLWIAWRTARGETRRARRLARLAPDGRQR
ncbi:presqualene diphosphate synthase HpnD [Thiohalobacter sp. IOR34]|uniref:presqualene diphosphate synthase HpnD n=1 Tax=Thiohalobacter sp. IOR34 TaxID=3057176 RepID=UPI0025B081D2|nr:presqualene diphosphate synthase HpnD [Thiohalobacter sp. IOR34]WJW76656.1 presqualene diphosphate synthase HpnD [Thiohalobacter sp. IOR34]